MQSKVVTLVIVLLINSFQLLYAQKTEERKLSAFTEISLRIGANVHLSQRNDQIVKVIGEEATLNKLITEVKDRKLIIRYPTESLFSSKWNPGKVDIFITIPEVDRLTVVGSGTITAENKIDSRILDLSLSGKSGVIRLDNLKAEKVTSILSGSGNLYLAGQEAVDEFNSSLSGSGNVKAGGLTATDVKIKISGSGNCWVNAIKNLNIRISGSGNVYYKGNPAVDSSIIGAGQVKKD